MVKRLRRDQAPPKPKPALEAIKSVAELLRYYDIKRKDWDALIISDGSGTTWKNTCGSGAFLIEKAELGIRPMGACMSHGTVSTSELMAILLPLMYLTANGRGLKEGGFNVHVFSDSEYVVKGLNRNFLNWLPSLKKNVELWLAVHGAQRRGLRIVGHYVPRDQLSLNKLAHKYANRQRLLQGKIKLSDLRAQAELFELD